LRSNKTDLVARKSWCAIRLRCGFRSYRGKSLSGASFTSLKQLEQHIDAYIKAYNVKAEPFV
jgi:hypothetical protein